MRNQKLNIFLTLLIARMCVCNFYPKFTMVTLDFALRNSGINFRVCKSKRHNPLLSVKIATEVTWATNLSKTSRTFFIVLQVKSLKVFVWALRAVLIWTLNLRWEKVSNKRSLHNFWVMLVYFMVCIRVISNDLAAYPLSILS